MPQTRRGARRPGGSCEAAAVASCSMTKVRVGGVPCDDDDEGLSCVVYDAAAAASLRRGEIGTKTAPGRIRIVTSRLPHTHTNDQLYLRLPAGWAAAGLDRELGGRASGAVRGVRPTVAAALGAGGCSVTFR